MKAKLILALSCLAGASAMAHADGYKAGFSGAVYNGAAADAGSFMKVARVFLGYDIYGHPIYSFRHARRVLLGFDRFGRPVYGYIINNRPVFLTRNAIRLIVRPARVDWDWGGRHWDRRWAGPGYRGEHRGWVEGEHRGWDRHDRDHMRPGYRADIRGGAEVRGNWENNRRPGGEMRGEDRHGMNGGEMRGENRHGMNGGNPPSNNTGTNGGTQAPSGGQTQGSGMRHDRRGSWQQNNNGGSSNQSPSSGASVSGSTGASAGSQGSSATVNSQAQGSATTQPQH